MTDTESDRTGSDIKGREAEMRKYHLLPWETCTVAFYARDSALWWEWGYNETRWPGSSADWYSPKWQRQIYHTTQACKGLRIILGAHTHTNHGGNNTPLTRIKRTSVTLNSMIPLIKNTTLPYIWICCNKIKEENFKCSAVYCLQNEIFPYNKKFKLPAVFFTLPWRDLQSFFHW